MAETAVHRVLIGSGDDWRVLRALAYYRWAVAVGVVGLAVTGRASQFIEQVNTFVFGLLGGLYLLLAITSTYISFAQRPSAGTQTHLNVGLDMILLGLMIYSAHGADSGLGMLLMPPAAGAASLTSRRLAAAIAAIATLALLGGEGLQYLHDPTPTPDYTQAGVLGVLLFIACLGAFTLAQRARSSEEIAMRSRLDLENLSLLNEHVIARMDTGVLVVDNAGRIRLANRTARQMLGLPAQVRDSLLADYSAPLAEWTSTWLHLPETTQEPAPIELAERRLLCRGVGLHDTHPPAVMLVLEDSAQADARAQQLKLAALGRLTASIAHEIRNPLSAISQAGQILREWENSVEEEDRLLDIIGRHAQRINLIIEDVLGLSRREPLNPSTVSVASFVRHLVKDYAESAGAPELHVDCSDIPAALQLRVDCNHLRRILTNLWDNAREHCGALTRIQVRAAIATDSQRAMIEVEDNGPGIAAGAADKIFEPFFTTRHGGVGLGLYIVRELCELNGARIKLVPGHGPGACFRITFSGESAWLA